MKELDLLKKDWNKERHPKVSSDSIYKMTSKKSSSVVKWIFIISIIEFLIWISLDLFPKNLWSEVKKMGPEYYTTNIILNIIHYALLIFFIVKFFLNYKKINTNDSIKQLMEGIINTRKTVKYYVAYNIAVLVIFFIILLPMTLMNEASGLGLENFSNTQMAVLILVAIVLLAITVVVFWLIYKLLYGFLMKKLLRNYKELKDLDL